MRAFRRRWRRRSRCELSGLYALDWESFELAIELMRDWRIDRYYADRTNLFTAPSKQPARSADLETAE